MTARGLDTPVPIFTNVVNLQSVRPSLVAIQRNREK